MQRENAEEDEAKSQMKTPDSGLENQHEGSGSGKRKFARGVKDLVRPREVLLHVCCTLKQGPGETRCNHTSPVGLKKSTAERGKTFRNCSIPANVNEELLE